MIIGTFDYNDKNLHSYLKGEHLSVNLAEYNYGAGGFPVIPVTVNHTTLGGTPGTDPYNVIDILTFDKVLTTTEMDSLGLYMRTRWGSDGIWTYLNS